MKKRKNLTIKLTSVIIGFTIVLLLVFALIIGFVGFNRFTTALTKEYTDSAYKTAYTASSFINADNIDSYIESKGNSDEYMNTQKQLDMLCETQDVSKIVVIVPDNDNNSFTIVFNSVNTTNFPEENSKDNAQSPDGNYNKYYRSFHEEKSKVITVVTDRIMSNIQPNINSMIPLKNSSGDVVAMVIVERYMDQLTSSRRSYIIWVGVITLVLMITSIIWAYKFVRKQIANPIKTLSDEAERFANENIKKKINSDRIISRVKEINSLENSIDKMETDTINYIENLTSVTKENERIGTELKLARSIQENALPNVFPAFPNRNEFDIFAYMNPAKEVGGDFYDFFLIDDDHLAIVIADVAGKGVPAALLMMNTKILINEHIRPGRTPAEILEYINARICENQDNMFVTVWFGILEISSSKLIASNAGHEDLVLYRKNKNFEIFKTKHCLAVGIMEDSKYENYELQLDAGDKLFVYTDGIPEARNLNGKMFGLDRMITELNKVRNKDVKNIIYGMKDEVDSFVNNATQFDDSTMLCLEIKEKEDDKK